MVSKVWILLNGSFCRVRFWKSAIVENRDARPTVKYIWIFPKSRIPMFSLFYYYFSLKLSVAAKMEVF